MPKIFNGNMRNRLISLCLLVLSLALIPSVLALTFVGFTDKFNYKINDTINYTGTSDQNLTSNLTIYLINSTGSLFTSASVTPNSTNFTTRLTALVPRSGDYFAKANFTFNSTYFESSSIVKISRAQSIVIAINKPAHAPGETINFTVRATDVNNIGVSDENVTIRLLYSTNDTVLSSSSGLTNSAGEYKGTFTAPSAIGSYRLTVNDWVATKIIDVSSFELVAFTGDSDGNIKTKFARGDTVYLYMDLFDTNKTRYTGTESLSVIVTYPNTTQNSSVSYVFSGSRVNTSFVVNDQGSHSIKVTVVSNSKSVTLQIDVGKYELVGWLERNVTETTTFFPNEAVNVRVKVFNVSTGEVIKTAGLDYSFDLVLLDSAFTNVSSISNSSTIDAVTGVRTFTFNATNTTGLYYVKITLNQLQLILDMKVANTFASATPVDQSSNFKNVFVGNKQTIRIITTLSNLTSSINVTNISAVSVKNSRGVDITSTLSFNTSIVEYKGIKAGLVEFASPPTAGLYFIKTLASNNFAAETQFLIKFYTVCAQLANYKWFISSSEDANLTVRVAEAKDISLIDSLAGNSTGSNLGSSFSGMYGLYDCYAEYKTTASGSSTAGNNTANIKVTVTRVVNTLNGEDVTTKVANLPSNNTDSNGRVVLTLTKPSGGWDGGTYVVELELRDQNNNTDKGFGAFQVKNLWINVWPKQISGMWKWYFSPTEVMSFQVNAYNSTGTWYWYGQSNGVGDNCYVLGLFYQGNGAEWFWPPKTVSTSKYTWTCTNTSSPANGRFDLNITPSSVFETGYYMVRVKVNTTAGVGDSGEGWFAIKAYNVYIRTTSNNWYDSWYKGTTDNVTLDIDITYANSTRWDCHWQKCPSSELVTDRLNITTKLIKYDEWMPKDYSTAKYNALFANSSSGVNVTNSLNTFSNPNATVVDVVVNSTGNVTYVTTSFIGGDLSSGGNVSNVSLSSAGSNISTTISLQKNSTINSASFSITPRQSSLFLNVSLNNSASFAIITNSTVNVSTSATFTGNLTSLLSSCTADAIGNCTFVFNVSMNSSGTVTLEGLVISYTLTQNAAFGSNTSVSFSIQKNATLNSAFIGINMTSGNFVANISLVDQVSSTTLASNFFNTSNLNTTFNNVSFGNFLSSALSSCTIFMYGNCSIRFNITLNGTGTVTLSNLLISYNTTQTNQTTSFSTINTTSGNASLTLIPKGGTNNNSWETGYYSAVVTVEGPQGKETSTYWFEIRSFFVNLQTVKAGTLQSVYSYTTGQNITLNVSATTKPSWLSSQYGVSISNVAASITAMKLSYWDQTTYQTVRVPATWSPSIINGATVVNVTPGSTLTAGNWYNLEVTLTDSSGNNQTGWAGFQVKDFTFYTSSHQWEYNNTQNIRINVAVCDGDTWWCNYNSNSYSGNAVNVTVNKLMKTETWPYSEVSGWTATSVQLNSSNNGVGNVTIIPTSTLAGGYYSAELTARYASGSGSTITQSVSFKIKSFTMSAYATKWEFSMSENATLSIITSASATVSDAYITCGYWPSKTTYSISGGTLSANLTSLSAGTNIVMLSPRGTNWVSGYCSGNIAITSGGETQYGYFSFNVKAFTLSTSQSKYQYLKNESVILTITAAAGQQYNITSMNITNYNNENGTRMVLRLGTDFTSNGTNQVLTGSVGINITPVGNWSFKGWHNGVLTAVASNNAGISQTAWFYFDIRDIFHTYGWSVRPGTTNYYNINTSSENVSLVVYTFKYNGTRTDWWPYDAATGINVTVTSIEKQSCTTWPCTYPTVTGWISDGTAISTSATPGNASAYAYLNLTRSGGWSGGWHYVNLRLVENSTGETATYNRWMGLWVDT